jgi:hypothetical protein
VTGQIKIKIKSGRRANARPEEWREATAVRRSALCGSEPARDAVAVDRSHALRGNAFRDAPRHRCARLEPGVDSGTQSVPGGIPTRSMGTISTRKR